MTRPAIGYYGGKQRLASKIAPMLPPHRTYVEPFAGGAAVFFAREERSAVEIINDTDGRLVNLYRVLQDAERCAELIRRLEATPYSRAECKRAMSSQMDEGIDGAWAYACSLSMSFAYCIGRGFGASKIISLASAWVNRVSNLHAAAERIRHACIESLDAIACIEKYDSAETCFYVDPPYPGTNQGHYRGYSQDDFDALMGALKSCRGSFVLSCYANESVPDDWTMHQFDRKCSVGGERVGKKHSTRRTECVWVVDRSDNFDASAGSAERR